MTLVLKGETNIGTFPVGQRVPVTLRLSNQGRAAVTLPARIVFDDLFFASTQCNGAAFSLVVGPPGGLPPGGREKRRLEPGESMDIALEDFTFRWQYRDPGHYQFAIQIRTGRKISNPHIVEFTLTAS